VTAIPEYRPAPPESALLAADVPAPESARATSFAGDRTPYPSAQPTLSRRATLLAIAAVVGLLWWFWWLIGPQLARPYVYDDVNFALGGRAVAQSGLPFGNQGYLLHLVEQREQWAIWHPPLYMFTLGLWIRLFGDGEVATRSLSVACLLLAAGIAFDIARRSVLLEGASTARSLLAGVVALAILLTNPLAVQVAQVLDIDNTVLTVLLAAFVWLAIRMPDRWDWKQVVGLGALFALLLWTKLTTPWILLAALVFTRAFQGLGVRGALDALAVGAFGSALFLATWVGIYSATGMPIGYTIDVLVREAGDSSASSRDRLVSVAAFVNGIAPNVLWLGPFFCLLFVGAGVLRLWSLLRGRGLRAADLLVVLGAAIYLVYFAKLAGNLPKYHASLLPLWAAACGILVARAVGRPSLAQIAATLITCAGLTWWLVPPMADEWTIAWTPGVVRQLVGIPLVVGALLAVAWPFLGGAGRHGGSDRGPDDTPNAGMRRLPSRGRLTGVPVALLVLAISWSVALDLAQRDRIGSTTYYYGRYGQDAAAEALGQVLTADEVYVASKEVAWYLSNQHYVDQESWHHVVWEERGGVFDGTYAGRDIRVLVLEVSEPSTRWAYEVTLGTRYRQTGEYGNFRVYQRAD